MNMLSATPTLPPPNATTQQWDTHLKCRSLHLGDTLRVRTQGARRAEGAIHKRTSPKVFAHTKELRREMTPLERKLWALLRAHRMKGVHFRPQHAIGDFGPS